MKLYRQLFGIGIVMLILGFFIIGSCCAATSNNASNTTQSTNNNASNQGLTTAQLTQMFLGILVLAFIIERIIQVITTVIDFGIYNGWFKESWMNLTEKDEDFFKKLLSTIIGFILGFGFVVLLSPYISSITLLNATHLLPANSPGYLKWVDEILTAIAIMGGTGPIHEFINALTAQGDKKEKNENEQGNKDYQNDQLVKRIKSKQVDGGEKPTGE